MKNKRLNLVFCLLLVLLLFSLPLMAQDTPQPLPVGLRADAPAYAVHGPYWVGTQTLELGVGTPDARRFTIWYPALNPEGLPEDVVYTTAENHVLRTLIEADVPYTMLGHALEHAAPDLTAAPYPLVIYSHGFTAPLWYLYAGEHLASYGFVVIAPEHASDSWDNVYTDVVTRMFEVHRAIDDAESFTAEGGILAGMIDIEHIAVGGHSAGGMESYGVVGAPLNWAAVEGYCVEVPEDAACSNLEAQHQEILAMLGTEADANGLIPLPSDTRVDAIFPISGSMEMYGEMGLAAVTVPTMAIYGSVDPAVPWLTPAYDFVSSRKAVLK